MFPLGFLEVGGGKMGRKKEPLRISPWKVPKGSPLDRTIRAWQVVVKSDSKCRESGCPQYDKENKRCNLGEIYGIGNCVKKSTR